ncbi:MAG: hypothetical protein JWO72_690 [Caulobacteraceae bacterium]|nr:hypothetical protein [Caulobacteraceae bacterium]
MKYVMTAALALSLMAGGAASAQDRHDDRGGRGGDHGGGGDRGGGDRGGGGGGPHNRAGQPLIQQQQAPAPQPQLQGRPEGQQPRSGQGFDRGQGGRDRGPGPQQRFDRGRAGPGPDQGFDRGRQGPGPGQNFDRGRQAGQGQNFERGRSRPGGFLDNRHWSFNQRFRGPAYRYPRGYGYEYWGFGAFLPLAFLTQDYTLYDYWIYGLPAPPPGYHWIRVGPDALLVRYGDGYVLDAAYGLFY